MTTLAEAVNQMIEVIGRFRQLLTDLASWAVGTATGGPNADGNYPFTMPDGTTVPVPSPALLKVTARSARDYSTDNWLYLSEPAERIQMALDAAFDDKKDVWIPRKATPYVFEHPGLYYPNEDGEWRRGLMRLRNGVSVRSNGASLKLTEGRTNPPGFFMQRYADDPRIDKVEFDGLLFDSGWRMLDPHIPDLNERYSFQNYAQHVDITSNTPWDVTQIGHQVSIWRGDEIRFGRCRFQNALGYGPALGQTTYKAIEDTTYPRFHGIGRAEVTQCQFDNLYHGGIFFPAAWDCKATKNVFTGDGYYVAAIDCERHHENDEVTGITIDDNLFDFRDGYGPVAFGTDVNGTPLIQTYGRSFLFKWRRAVSFGYFVGSENELARGHRFTRNRVFQGMVENFGHRDVTIDDNTIVGSFEDLSPGNGLPPNVNLIDGQHAIRLYRNGKQQVDNVPLDGCKVTTNRILGDIQGWGIHMYGYDGVEESGNQIEGPRSGAVRRQHCSGQSTGLIARNVGTEAAPAPVYQMEGGRGPTVIAHPTVEDSRVQVIPGAGPNDPPAAIIPHYGTDALVKMVGAINQYTVEVFGANGFEEFRTAPFITAPENAPRLKEWGNFGTGFITPTFQLGTGTGSLAAHIVTGIDQSGFIDFWNGSFQQPRLFMGVPSEDRYGFVMLAFKPSGAADLVAQFNGVTRAWNFLAGRFNIRGDWQNPLGFIGGRKLFMDADGMMKLNFTDPTWGGDGDTVMLKVPVPAAANAPGLPGQIAIGGGWEYTCVAKDTWVRKAVGASW